MKRKKYCFMHKTHTHSVRLKKVESHSCVCTALTQLLKILSYKLY